MNWTLCRSDPYSLLTSDKRTSSFWLFFFFTWLPTFTPVVQSCAELSNHIPSQLFFTLSLCWLPRRQWSEVWEVEQWFGMSVSFFFFFKNVLFILFLSFLFWHPGSIILPPGLMIVLSVSVQCAACERAIMSADPRRPNCSHIFCLWFHNSWTDASILPLARNLSAATGKRVFSGELEPTGDCFE